VSLILDALKKLEREKDAREPGVLVVGSVPWGARAHSYRPLALVLAGAGLAALLAWAAWPRDRAPRPATVPSPADASPAAARVPTTPPPAPAVAPPEPRRLVVPSPAAEPAEVPPPERAAATGETPAGAPLPPAAAAPAKDDLRLNAISQRDGRPLALINDRLFFEGDSFDGVKILRIGEAEVEVEVHGKRRVLRF
jgi:hypothetical protein